MFFYSGGILELGTRILFPLSPRSNEYFLNTQNSRVLFHFLYFLLFILCKNWKTVPTYLTTYYLLEIIEFQWLILFESLFERSEVKNIYSLMIMFSELVEKLEYLFFYKCINYLNAICYWQFLNKNKKVIIWRER